MIFFLILTAVTFSLLGFIIGIWADNFEKLQLVPLLIVTPLTFLGGSFYSINMLPPFWQAVTLFNPVVYLISGFRWSFYGVADVRRVDQPGHDWRLPRRLHCHRHLDAAHGLSAQERANGAGHWRWRPGGVRIEAGDRVAFDELGKKQDDHSRESGNVEESRAAVEPADHPGPRHEQQERSGNAESVVEDGDVAHGFGKLGQIPQLARAQVRHPDAH
jgi:hypothetical protein